MKQESNPQEKSLRPPSQSQIESISFAQPKKKPEEVFKKKQEIKNSSSLMRSQSNENISAHQEIRSKLLPEQHKKKQTESNEEPPSPHSRSRKGSFIEKLSQMQQSQEEKLNAKKKADARAIFLENVDYKSTKEELELLFQDCGTIDRITILKNPLTNHPKGCAYISFQSQEGVERALYLSGVNLRGRVIRIHRKRTNLPGHQQGKKQDLKMNLLGMMQTINRNALRGRGRGRAR